MCVCVCVCVCVLVFMYLRGPEDEELERILRGDDAAKASSGLVQGVNQPLVCQMRYSNIKWIMTRSSLG